MTQKRLAALAGVHPSTVSLALADDPRLPAPTRERVKRLAVEHRYAPNPAARWLRHARTGTLGLVFWGEAHLEEDGRAHVGLPLMAAVEAAVAAGHQALVIPATRERLKAADEPGIEALVRRAPIDGAVFFGTTHDREGLARLVRSGFPAVHFGMRALRGADLAYAAADYRAGSRAAVAHLISQGHRRVAMVEDPRFVAEIGAERSAGYADALSAAGIAPVPELLVRAAALDERRVDYAGVLARLREVGATAAFCTTGILGIELLRACVARGVRVPEELALAAFDDEPEAATTSPPLTAVRQPVARIAAAAVTLLLRLAAGEDVSAEERHRLLPPELIVRASSLRSAAR
ncbi:MAG TPA: LacI family DNA-binding transcriptional regulator [Chloroflexota bacterium]|nr:LacI family DNA-binding transcriptional regulator [Chloroflexota bacterium]